MQIGRLPVYIVVLTVIGSCIQEQNHLVFDHPVDERYPASLGHDRSNLLMFKGE